MQAYHNELVSKVSHLEEENIKLKKEKVEKDISFLSVCLFFFYYKHMLTTATGNMKRNGLMTKLELVFQTFNLCFAAVQIIMYSELFQWEIMLPVERTS